MDVERLGVMGGTFDPPHYGHLQVAQEAVEQLSLHRVLFLVAGIPPHKMREDLSPGPLRVEMVEAATEGNDAFESSEMEVEREGPSYTVDTLRSLRSSDPDSRLFLIVGADQLAEFHEWKEPVAIARMATVVAVPRNGMWPGELPSVDLGRGRRLDLLWLKMERMDHSSTDIRRRVREGRSIRYLVPAAVKKIIETHRLYRSI